MTEPSNIRVLSDDDAQALLPILADVGRIVNWSRFEDGELPELSSIGLPFVGKREPARKTIVKNGKVWRY